MLAELVSRAQIIQKIRQFFAERGVLEVDTPLLYHAPVTDPYLDAFEVNGKYLQTSPEYAMKCLLAEGVGSCYQICKAFREDETGRLHNPEFTMLEWYRVGFDDTDLMDETDALLQLILNCTPAKRLSYHKAFETFLNLDLEAHVSCQNLDSCHSRGGGNPEKKLQNFFETKFGPIPEGKTFTQDDWLMLLFTHGIEPKLTGDTPYIIYNYPASQAALAKTHQDKNGNEVAARFEVFYQGIELANAYHELTDPIIQRKRFEQDLATRKALGKKIVPIDEKLMQALEKGLPNCAGIAMGLDRLIMLATGAKSIHDVIAISKL